MVRAISTLHADDAAAFCARERLAIALCAPVEAVAEYRCALRFQYARAAVRV